MNQYIIGDVHGCFYTFNDLLEKINFSVKQDILYSVGDLINKGKYSNEVLDFFYNNNNICKLVLGNHDFFIPLLVYNKSFQKTENNYCNFLDKIKQKLIDYLYWFRKQKLLIKVANNYICHAGIYPFWSLNEAEKYSFEIEQIFNSDSQFSNLIKNLIGNKPNIWHNKLTGIQRYKFIINAFTRMRFMNNKNIKQLNLNPLNTKINDENRDYAWFNIRVKQFPTAKQQIIFGHWASILGKTNLENIIGLDTGCYFNGYLTAYDINNKKKIAVKLNQKDL